MANDQTAKVSEPGKGAFPFPATLVAAQCATVVGARFAAIPAVRRDQFNAPRRQLHAERITFKDAIGNDAPDSMTRSAAKMLPAHADRRERFCCEPHSVGRCGVKPLSQRNTLASTPPSTSCPCPAWFFRLSGPFFAGAKLPSGKDSFQSTCSRWFNSAGNPHQMVSQTSRSSQSRQRGQHVADEETRRAHPASEPTAQDPQNSFEHFATVDRWSAALLVRSRFGSQRWNLSHCASVSSRPYRAVDLPSACCTNLSRIFKTGYKALNE